jgi:hypothetical protein
MPLNPTQQRLLDTALEAKQLLAAHDRTLEALGEFQRENAKDQEKQMHPAQYAHLTLAEYAILTLP